MGSKSSSGGRRVLSASSDLDPTELEDLPIPQLIKSLLTSFLRSDYESVTRILVSREESAAAALAREKSARIAAESHYSALQTECEFLNAKRAELESKIKKVGESNPKVADLERRLKEAKDRHAFLDAQHGELEIKRFAAAEEAEKYKRNSEQLQESLERAMEDLAVLTAREERAQELIDRLRDELSSRDHTEKFVALKTENQDLKCGKQRAQKEVEKWLEEAEKWRHKAEEEVAEWRHKAEEWRGKYSDAEVQALKLFDENLAIKAKLDRVEKCRISFAGEDCNNRQGTLRFVKLELVSEKQDAPMHGCLIEISDSEEEMDDGAHGKADVDDSVCEEIYMPKLSEKMKNSPLVASNGSRGDNYAEEDDDDQIPIGKLKRKRLFETIQKSTEASASGTASKKQFSPLRRCQGANKSAPVASQILKPALIYDVHGR